MSTKISGSANINMTDRNMLVWNTKAIGEPFFLRDDLTGVNPPPTNMPEHFRFIKLTASDAYNSGVLTGEVVTGSGVNITATAIINMVGSPMNGVPINLINTEKRFLRAGVAGTLEDSQNLAHNHTASSGVNNVSHSHTGTTSTAGNHSHNMFDASASGTLTQGPNGSFVFNSGTGGIQTGASGNHTHTFTTGGVSANHTHPITVNNDGGTEARPKNISGTVYMRIFLENSHPKKCEFRRGRLA